MELTIDAKGMTVFVAGGTSGINLGIAEGFARAGARVAVMSRSQAKIDHAVESLQSLGCDAIGGAADVRDYDATASVLKTVHDEFGDLDVLVSGAAGNFLASAVGMSPKAFRAVVDIDLIGTYHVLRAAYAHAPHAASARPIDGGWSLGGVSVAASGINDLVGARSSM